MNQTSSPPVLSGMTLSKSYGATRALDGVDIAVHAGESVAVMGPSGSGKSTLLHCLANIERPDSGQVLLADERIDELREPARSELRRTRFGFVFQSGQLLPELPAVENVALPLMLGGTPRRTAEQRARQWFPPLGLTGKEDSRPGALSGGQAQRVALARALVTDPRVVFADEPTGALDQATGQEVIRLLTEVTREQRAALVVVTHDASVARWCDRTAHVRDGRLVDEVGGAGSVGAGHSGADGIDVPDGTGCTDGIAVAGARAEVPR
ncbi:ABC transporter ATP-binding protein [Streptomyces oceani]|uniref:ABC transporter ATP-binding protein n=1 Tax=Streptomyces oceani TaxID=1075402 RepID=UPI0009A10BE1|nr:ABC transporter ATP-binding protein [Streptomyces oceani]